MIKKILAVIALATLAISCGPKVPTKMTKDEFCIEKTIKNYLNKFERMSVSDSKIDAIKANAVDSCKNLGRCTDDEFALFSGLLEGHYSGVSLNKNCLSDLEAWQAEVKNLANQ